MKTTKSGNVAERAAVNNLIKQLKRKTPGVYVFTDRDAGSLRHTSSGWDFMLARGPYCVFVEAKVGAGALTEYQDFTRMEVQAAGGRYIVLRFSATGNAVSIDGGPTKALSGVGLGDFFRGGAK